MSRFVTSFVTLISPSWMKELIPIFWQMTGMVIDYSLEPFWVPDLHPRSQEHPPKSWRVPDFFENVIRISWCFSVFWGHLATFFSGLFLEKWLAKIWVSGNFFRWRQGKAPLWGQRPLLAACHHKNNRSVGPQCSCIIIYIYKRSLAELNSFQFWLNFSLKGWV